MAKALAIIGAINGIAPIAAPVVGGVALDYVGWQGIFAVLLMVDFIAGNGEDLLFQYHIDKYRTLFIAVFAFSNLAYAQSLREDDEHKYWCKHLYCRLQAEGNIASWHRMYCRRRLQLEFKEMLDNGEDIPPLYIELRRLYGIAGTTAPNKCGACT